MPSRARRPSRFGQRCVVPQSTHVAPTCSRSLLPARLSRPRKGWSRLGECEDARGCYAEAALAFEKAIELDPSNAGYKSSKAGAEAKAKRAAAAAPSGGGGGGASSVRMLGLLLVRLLMFTNGALYLLSFTTNQKYLDSKFRACVQFYLCAAVVNFAQVHGFPKFTKEYLQKTVMDPAVQRIFGGVLLLLGSNFMALVALLLPEAAALFSSVVHLLRSFGLSSVALRITASLEGTLLDGHGNPYYKVAQYAAYAEVATGILLILTMLTPRRNLILMVLYWQVSARGWRSPGASCAQGRAAPNVGAHEFPRWPAYHLA